MSEIILFDIDNTLLDTKKLMEHFILPSLQEHLVSEPEHFFQVSDRYWLGLDQKTAFDPEQYLLHLSVSFEAHVPALRQLFYTPHFFEQSLFPDVFEVLKKLTKSHLLGIFSQGGEVYQQQKLQLAGIDTYFSPNVQFIDHEKTSDRFLNVLPAAHIVDDSLEVIQVLTKQARFTPIWLNRDSLSQKSDTFCDTIYTLTEIPALVA